ncbi:MAG: hypothetical protein WC372_03830 [Candidatus Neomarinimicrobiota bacterium]|jgi:hypothetical protein|nr:hypothetical protein [Candidatus Neomarinimicrobiota bacterium]MDD3966040.1 hypothetical protein [Candidatus Neomarinimicrobiota bacterium]MDX9780476.1 hypothetical protein [bacterium]
MGVLLNIILVAIFFYLLFRIFVRRRFFNFPKGPDDLHASRDEDTAGEDVVRKSIDMSNVEDADYKEIEE